MAERQINAALKQALELGPTIIFFGLYLWMRDKTFSIQGTEYSGFIMAALIFVPILLVSMALLWWLSGTISRMQVFTAVMVIFFGGLTAWFNDERFFKMKTTLVYGAIAGLLGVGLLMGKSYLKWVMAEMLPMQDEGWMLLTRRVALIFATLAVANEIIWRNFSTDTWVKLETFAFPLIMMAALAAQIMSMQKYLIEDKTDGDAGGN